MAGNSFEQAQNSHSIIVVEAYWGHGWVVVAVLDKKP